MTTLYDCSNKTANRCALLFKHNQGMIIMLSQYIFAAAVAIDIVYGIISPTRVFTLSPLCGVGLGIEIWLTGPAVAAAVVAETTTGQLALCAGRTRDTLIAIVVYRLVQKKISCDPRQ